MANHRLTAQIVRAMRGRYAQGESIKALAQTYGLSGGRASDIVHGRAWAHIEGSVALGAHRVRRAPVDLSRVARGSRVGNARLDDPTVRELRAQHAAGLSYSALARQYRLSVCTVRRAVLGETWAHVH